MNYPAHTRTTHAQISAWKHDGVLWSLEGIFSTISDWKCPCLYDHQFITVVKSEFNEMRTYVGWFKTTPCLKQITLI